MSPGVKMKGLAVAIPTLNVLPIATVTTTKHTLVAVLLGTVVTGGKIVNVSTDPYN